MKLKTFEILSAVGTIIFGSILHFVFDWAGNWPPVALIAAVNESTWEHLKLAFWPALIFAAIYYFTVKPETKIFFLAQAKKLYVMPILIIAIFYGGRALGIHSFIYDISNFIVSVIFGHILAYYIEAKQWPQFVIRYLGDSLSILTKIAIVILLIAFSLLTYFPPKNVLFLDPQTGGYGIVK